MPKERPPVDLTPAVGDFTYTVKEWTGRTAGMEVMFQARGSKKLVIIDASSTGSQPGAVFKVPGKELESLPETSYNLHDFRWDNALAAGRKIFKDDFPTEVIVYLIEAENLGFGLELSPVVEESANLVFTEITTIIQNF